MTEVTFEVTEKDRKNAIDALNKVAIQLESANKVLDFISDLAGLGIDNEKDYGIPDCQAASIRAVVSDVRHYSFEGITGFLDIALKDLGAEGI